MTRTHEGQSAASFLAKVVLFCLSCCSPVAIAADLHQVRRDAIAWLERHQNEDGSWGVDPTRQLVTAEAVYALATAGRVDGAAVRNGVAWLENQEYLAVDYRARAVRALVKAGATASALQLAQPLIKEGGGVPPPLGWGTVAPGVGSGSYDSAVALAALRSIDLATPAADLSVLVPWNLNELEWLKMRRRPVLEWGG